MQLTISSIHDFTISFGLSMSNYIENLKISLFRIRLV